jgi:hypothetical protein
LGISLAMGPLYWRFHNLGTEIANNIEQNPDNSLRKSNRNKTEGSELIKPEIRNPLSYVHSPSNGREDGRGEIHMPHSLVRSS